MSQVAVTMLNSMASGDFAESLAIQKSWGIEALDLKDAIFGKSLLDLTWDESKSAAEMIRACGMSVYCLSSGLFFDDIEKGPELFEVHLERVFALMGLASVFQPKVVRLLAARSSRRPDIPDMRTHIPAAHPWLLPLYRHAIDRCAMVGIPVTIENEVGGCILSSPEEITWFFEALDRPGKVSFTYDPGNLWQQGVFPTHKVYDELAPLIGYLHLKGGLRRDGTNEFLWQGALEDTPWPVAEIAQAYVSAGVGQAICLNPPHGELKPGVDYENRLRRDLEFVRKCVKGAV
jgi:sugar phosphate isomerase/epimerase